MGQVPVVVVGRSRGRGSVVVGSGPGGDGAVLGFGAAVWGTAPPWRAPGPSGGTAPSRNSAAPTLPKASVDPARVWSGSVGGESVGIELANTTLRQPGQSPFC